MEDVVVVGMVEVVGKAVVGVFATFWRGHVGFGVVDPSYSIAFCRTREEVVDIY